MNVTSKNAFRWLMELMHQKFLAMRRYGRQGLIRTAVEFVINFPAMVADWTSRRRKMQRRKASVVGSVVELFEPRLLLTVRTTPDDTDHASAPEVLARLESNADFQLMYQLQSPDPVLNFHIYTTSTGERDALKLLGYTDQTYDRPGFAVATGPREGFLPLYRLYNPNNGQHYFTLSIGERDYLDAVGWNYEKVEGHMAPNPVPGMTQISHLYSGRIGDHFFTEQRDQADGILAQSGNDWVEHRFLGYTLGLPNGDNKVTATVDKTYANVGDLVKVTVRMDALGLGALVKTDMRLQIPNGATLESSTAPTSSTDEYEVTSQYVRWQVLHSDPAAPFNDPSPTADFFFRIGPAAAGRTLQWRAAISSVIADYNVLNNTDVETTVVAPQTIIRPNVAIGLTGPAAADSLTSVVYRVTLTNTTGVIGQNPVVSIPDVPGLVFQSSSSSNAVHGTSGVTYRPIFVGARSSTFVDLTYQVSAASGAVTLQSSVSMPNDAVLTDNIASRTLTVNAVTTVTHPNVAIGLTGPTTADTLATVVFRLTLTNTTGVNAQNPVATIPDVPGLVFQSSSSTTAVHGENGVTYSPIFVGANSSKFVDLTYQVSATSGAVTLQGSVSMPSDAVSTDNIASRTLTVNSVTPPTGSGVDDVVQVTANDVVAPNTTTSVILTFFNEGTTMSTGTQGVLTFTGMTFITADNSAFVLDPNNPNRGVVDLFFLAPNQTDIYTILVTLGTGSAGTKTVKGTITEDQIDDVFSNSEDVETILVG